MKAGTRAFLRTFLFSDLLLPSAAMTRVMCILILCLTITPSGWAGSEEMERLASRISDEIRDNLMSLETKVAYVGMDGTRAYLMGDLAAVRPGQGVAFYRDGSAMMSMESPPRVLGRESVEVGRGKVTAIHDRTAWVQVDTGARTPIERGDWAVVQLDVPLMRVIPFFVDDGTGSPKQDGRGRILRSLVLYNLKRHSLKVLDAPLLPSEVDPAGLPLPAALGQFDTDGVLLIGRLLPKPASPNEMVVGIALFDLSLRDMRFARSYDVQALEAFSPAGMVEAVRPPPRPALQGKLATTSAPAEPPALAEPLKGVFRMHLSTTLRPERPMKTPADAALAELVSVTLPDAALEWIEDSPGKIRIVLPAATSTPTKMRDLAKLLNERGAEPAAKSLIGMSRWSAQSDNELILTLESPVPDIRDRLADPEFRLMNDQFEEVGPAFAPYRIASKGVRTVILAKTEQAGSSGVWARAPDTMELTVERDPRKRSKGFQGGEVDLHDMMDEEFLKFGPASGSRVIQSAPEELVVLAFNLRRKPGTDVHFRRMIAMALDRRTVLELSLNQRGTPAEGMLPPEAKGVASVLVKLPEKSLLAAQVLAKERVDTGRLVIIFPVEEAHYGLIAEGIRSDLTALNLTIEPAGLSWRAYADRLADGEYDLALATLTPVSPYRLWLQRNFATTGNDNRWGYRNSIVDALVSESGDLGAAQDLIQSDLPVIPLFWLTRRLALGPRISEVWPSVFPSKFFSSIRIK